jgi:hypothetical protein
MRSIVLLLSALCISMGCATAQSNQPFESIEIACTTAPPEAKTQLPPKIAEWAVLSCTRFGHVVRAAQGWVWHNPKTNSFVRVWAQPTEGNLKESGNDHYFKSIEFRQLPQTEAEHANALLATALGAKPQPVAEAYSLVLQDEQDRTRIINFVRGEANVRLGNYWGWTCTEPCVNPQIFFGIKPRQ